MKHTESMNMAYSKIEIYLIAIMVFLKFVMMDWLNMRVFYISAVCLIWVAYIYYRHTKDKTVLIKWGFRRQNFRKSSLVLLPFTVVSIAGSLVYGRFSGHHIQNWHILLILALYLVWGTFQQFIIVNLIVQNLTKPGPLFTVVIGSFLFCLVHSPDVLLMTYTFFMEALFIYVFLKFRNIWALGLVHGVVATFLLYFVQHRDLWLELFSWFNQGI